MFTPLDRLDKLTHIVSLGSDCQITHNIRRYFLIEKAYPFDWWITPFEGVIKFLTNPDVDFLFDPSKLKLVRDDDRIINMDVGISYHHDFPRSGFENKIDSNFIDSLESVKNKYRHVINNFLSLNAEQNSILFLRTGESFGREQEIVNLLDELFFKAKFSLLFVEKPRCDHNEWTGSEQGWDELFAALNLNKIYYR